MAEAIAGADFRLRTILSTEPYAVPVAGKWSCQPALLRHDDGCAGKITAFASRKGNKHILYLTFGKKAAEEISIE